MRWFVTILMLILVLVGGAWLFVGERIRPLVGLPPSAGPSDVGDPALETLTHLRPDKVQKIDVTPPGHPTFSLTRTADGGWSQPGNWPVRVGEAVALLNTVTGLRTRFHPIPLTEGDSELTKYGLAADQKPTVAVVHLEGRAVTLRFGQSPDSTDATFGRPCYLRVDDNADVLKLGPDVFPIVARSPEVYRRRQLFPDVERVKLSGGEPVDPMRPQTPPAARVAILGDAFTTVRLDRSSGEKLAVTLKRTAPTPEPRRDPERPSAEPGLTANQLAAVWELLAEIPEAKDPAKSLSIRDHVDPGKLRTVLTAIPELWVEKFVEMSPQDAGLSEAGADKPAYSISVTRTNGQPLTLRLGKVSRTVDRVEDQPPPSPFAPPPPPPKVTTEEYRYAKLDNNPLVFEIRTDKLTPLFADAESYRDPQLARFETAEVTELTVTRKGQPPIVITRKKGNKDADRDEDRQDRWYVGEGLAEASKVTELLDSLSKLEARGKDGWIDGSDAAKLKELDLEPAGTKVTVVAQARVGDGEPAAPARSYTFVVGKDDTEKKKLAVQLAGWPRVNLVDDAVLKLVDRSALAYRSRRLFDTAEAKLTGITVKRDSGDPFALVQQGSKWVLTQPVNTDADPAKAAQLTGDLGRLEAAEFVDDAPKPEDLDKKYGLAKPRFTVDLAFTGTGAKPQSLQVGSVREGKPESYARLNGTGGVFAIPQTTVAELEAGSLALLPLQLWSAQSDKLTAVEIRRSEADKNEAYRLTRDGSAWKLTGPFDAAVSFPDLQPLLAALATVRAEKYEAHGVTDPAKYGFDKPALRLGVTYLETPPLVPGQPPLPDVAVSKTLVIGKPTTDGAPTRFVRLDGPSAAVFVLPDNLLLEANKPALGWLDKTILSLDSSRVKRIELTGPTPESAITFVSDGKGDWKAEGVAFPIDRPTVDALLITASRPPVAKLAAYGAGVNWAAFGLDKPTHTVTLTMNPTDAAQPPVRHTVKLGKVEPNGDRYVRADDGPAVGVLLPRAGDALARTKLDFVDRTLLAFDPSQLTAFGRKIGKDDLEIAQAGFGWDIVKPAKQKADAPSFDELADQLSHLRAVKVAAFAPSDADLAKFGLKEPVATFTLKLGTEKPTERVLKIGGPVDAKLPDGDRYAIAVPVDPKAAVTVGILPAPMAQKLLADPLKFREKSLAKFVDADKITLQRGDRKVTFAKIDGTWKMTEPVAAPAEQIDLDEFVNAAAKLRADELVADKPKELKPFGLDQPEAKWTFFENGKEVLALLVGSKDKDGKRVFAKLDKGDLVALLDSALTGKVLGEYRKRVIWGDADASQGETLVISSGTANTILRKAGPLWMDASKPGDQLDQGKVTETLAAFAGLKAERFVADKDAKPELYGLDKPSRVIVFTQRSVPPKTLQIGGPVGGTNGKQVYAKLGDPTHSEVFVLSEADTEKLTRDRIGFAVKK